MWIILGCAKTIQIEIMRREQNFPRIYHRIIELIVVAVVNVGKRGDNYSLYLLGNCQNVRNNKVTSFDRNLYENLLGL